LRAGRLGVPVSLGNLDSKIVQDLSDQFSRFEAQHGLAAIIVRQDVQAPMPKNPAIERSNLLVHPSSWPHLHASELEVPNGFRIGWLERFRLLLPRPDVRADRY
jgi:hypothetical protein